MKILYSHYLNDAAHPAVRMVEQIAAELRALGQDVLVHASAGLAGTQDSAAQHPAGAARQDRSRPASWLRRRLWFAKALARNRHYYPDDRAAVTSFGPDVVLARQDAYCWSMVQAACHLGVPVVTYADAPVAYETRTFNEERRWHPPGVVESIERWGLARSAAVITVSAPAKRCLQRYASLKVPIHVIANGVDPSRFPERTPELVAQLRAELQLSAPVILGFQGTFRGFHGIDRLQQIMLATRDLEQVQWLLIGDGPERMRIEQAVAGRVKARFLGRQPPEEMGRLLTAIDIAIAPHAQLRGDFYFCPLKVLEYAASGCAVVASCQGDIPRLLAAGTAGVIVPSDDVGQWVEAIRQLVADQPRRQALAAHARRHVLDRLTWAETARHVQDVLQQSLTQPC